MSEMLAQLKKKGGKTLMPTTPDALYKNNSMAFNGTATLAVNKKPRLLMLSVINASNNYMVGLLDVENETAYRYAYFANANHDGVWENWENYFTSITDNSVSIKNRLSDNCNVRLGAYY